MPSRLPFPENNFGLTKPADAVQMVDVQLLVSEEPDFLDTRLVWISVIVSVC